MPATEKHKPPAEYLGGMCVFEVADGKTSIRYDIWQGDGVRHEDSNMESTSDSGLPLN